MTHRWTWLDKLKWLAGSAIFRMLALVVVLIVPIDLTTLVLSSRAIVQVENQISADIQNALELNMRQVDYQLDRLSYRLYYLSTKDQDYIRLHSKTPDNDKERQAELNSVVRLQITMTDIRRDYPWANYIFAYFPEKDYFIQSGQGDMSVGRALAERIASGASDAETGRWYAFSEGGSSLLLRIVRYRGSYYGAWLDLGSLLEKMDLSFSDNLVLFQRSDGLVLTGEGELSERYAETKGQSLRYQGEQYLALEAGSSCGDLVMVELVSRSELHRSLPILLRMLRYAAALALLLIPFLVVFLNRYLVRPVVNVADAMSTVRAGDLGCRIEDTNESNEFRLINHSFNDMMDQVQQLKIDVYEQELEKQKIRMQYLSQQIQPHFILNAMNIIYSYEADEYPLIQKAVLCLSKYFRFVVNANAPYVKLKHEFEHIENYFAIEKIRHPDKLNYAVRFDATSGECLIPPLIIQNLADNINKYALKDEGVTDVLLSAKAAADGHVHIRLSDTGRGIPAETLEKIRRFQQTGEAEEGLGVGIPNTIERLALFTGGQAQIAIDRAEAGTGTVIDIVIPMTYLPVQDVPTQASL